MGEEILPSMALAVTVAGEAKCVKLPVPCRPIKFRFEELIHLFPFGTLSSFIPRHNEHPGILKSAPASLKILSNPSI